jgi:hypothetical protein
MAAAMLNSKSWCFEDVDPGSLGEVPEEPKQSSSKGWRVTPQISECEKKVGKTSAKDTSLLEHEIKFITKKYSPFQNGFWLHALRFKNIELQKKFNEDNAIHQIYTRQRIPNMTKFPVMKMTPTEMGDVMVMLQDAASKIRYPEFKLGSFQDNGETKLHMEAFWDKKFCQVSRSE